VQVTLYEAPKNVKIICILTKAEPSVGFADWPCSNTAVRASLDAGTAAFLFYAVKICNAKSFG
jgi:hypothetical protein